MANGITQKKENAAGANTPAAVLRGLIFGLVGAALALLIISALAVFYDIPDKVMNILIILISVASMFAAGLTAAGRNGKNGMIIGMAAGLIYAAIICAAGIFVCGAKGLSPEMIADFAIGGAVGALGGVAGVNRAAGKRRKRK